MEAECKPVTALPSGVLSSYGSDSENNLLFSFCPTGRLFAFVSTHKGHFIATEEHPELNRRDDHTPFYQNSFQGILDVICDPLLARPIATACIVLPVVLLRSGSPQVSSIVMVGFNDGWIGAYSKTGRRIFNQQLHTESVLKLKVMTPSPTSTNKSTTSNLVVLFTGGVVCIIDGSSLAEVIEEKVSLLNRDDSLYNTPHSPGTSLIYKKFNLEQQHTTLDVALVGHSVPSSFDHLREASMVEGYDTIIRQGPLSESKLITVGEQPMISLYRVNKDAGTVNMTEVVQEVASRMTNAVLDKLSFASGWLGWGGGGGGKKSTSQSPSQAPPTEEKLQRSLNLKMSTNIADTRRQVHTIVVSPVGNLAALVDGFGRVLLLDTGSLVVRRMWKGYRGAQCGWLLVTDPAESKRKAQCLCIYLPRGVLEFWPVQSGPRAAVFTVGKGCRLLYSSSCIFGKNELIKELNSTLTTSYGNTAMLQLPDGKIITFTIPFPSLIKRSNPLSHDFHYLQKLNETISKGMIEKGGIFETVALSVKSSQAMLEIVQLAVQCYSSTAAGNKLLRAVIVKVLDIAVNRTVSNKNCTVPEELFKHFSIIRALSKMYFELEDGSPPRGGGKEGVVKEMPLPQLLMTYCGLSNLTYGERIGSTLETYFDLSSPPSPPLSPSLTLADFLSCFSLQECTINCLLPEEGSVDSVIDSKLICEVKCKNDLTDSRLVDLAYFMFKMIFSTGQGTNLFTIFESSPLSYHTLIRLLFKLILSGTLQTEKDPKALINPLHSMMNFLIKDDIKSDVNFCNELITILSCSTLVGHALLLALLCRHLIDHKGRKDELEGSDSVEEEQWETVTIETEQWSQLIEHLELLTLLSLIIGHKGMKCLPSIVHTTEEMEEEMGGSVDISQLELKMFFEDEGQGVCVMTLETTGPVLLAHCIARNIVECKMKGTILNELRGNTPAASHLLKYIQLMVSQFPATLSVDNLLLYSSFHAAFQWSENIKKDVLPSVDLLLLSMDYMEYIQSCDLLRGLCSFLWHTLIEKELFQLVEVMKKRVVSRDRSNSTLLWVCRSLLHCIEQLSINQPSINSDNNDRPSHDSIPLQGPAGILFLHSLVKLFPILDQSLVQNGFQLLFLSELILNCNATVSVFTYFAPVVRSWWKKGLFLSHYKEDAIGRAVLQKRLKFVKGAVTILINDNNNDVCISPPLSFVAFKAITSSQCYGNVGHLSDVTFSLSCLWELDEIDVKCSWIANLIAVGLIDNSRQVFQSIHDKERAAVYLIPIIGQLSLHLMDHCISKTTRNLLIAQTSPNLLEWIRNQKTACDFLAPFKLNASNLYKIIELVRPHVKENSKISELSKLVQVMVASEK